MDRRNFLWQLGGGLGSVALAQLLGEAGLLAETAPRPEFNGGLHHPAKAKRVVQLFMSSVSFWWWACCHLTVHNVLYACKILSIHLVRDTLSAWLMKKSNPFTS
jgi:hypothetical protein